MPAHSKRMGRFFYAFCDKHPGHLLYYVLGIKQRSLKHGT